MTLPLAWLKSQDKELLLELLNSVGHKVPDDTCHSRKKTTIIRKSVPINRKNTSLKVYTNENRLPFI